MPDSPRQTHRSFTVRVPMDQYLEIGKRANEDGAHMNTKVNELLTLGLGREINLNKALAKLLKKAAIEDISDDEA